MSLSAAAIRILAQKGLSACDIADVAEANEAVRSSAAARQKRYRDNKRDVTRDVTRPPYEDTSTPQVSPDDANASSAPRGRPTKTMIPVDWSPPPIAELSPKARSCAEQWSADAYAAQAEEFAGYWRSARRKMADWPATWANRVLHQHAKVMRDAKFGVSYGPAKVVQLDPDRRAERLDERAKLMRSIGNHDEADGDEREAARLRKSASIGSLVSNVSQHPEVRVQ